MVITSFAVSLCALAAGCKGSEELPGDGPPPPNAGAPGGDHLRGSDQGVSFDYRGGTVTVDLSGASDELRRQVIGEKIVVDCGGADQSRRWPEDAGNDLTIGLTREATAPRDVPIEISSCSLEPVPGAPLAVAKMRSD